MRIAGQKAATGSWLHGWMPGLGRLCEAPGPGSVCACRLRRGETKQQDLERSMKRHVEQMSQAATHAEGELQRTQTMEELAEMRRLEMDAQRRERAAERRSKWEQRRVR